MRVSILGMVVAVSGMAAGLNGAGAADLSHLRAMAGQYTDEILADPVLASELRQNLGAGYDAFVEAMQVVFPSELIDDRFLVMSGCMAHDCAAHRGLVLLDLEGGGVQVVRSNLFGAFIPLTPAAEAAIDAWVH
ncbi:MAG: hypothetical protein ACFCVH_09900 [Alphaproteobacteria bacterium]